MHLVPLSLGVLAIVIGVAMIGFGIPINEFGIGNTLIGAGTTAIVGGFILVGLWAAVIQLKRLNSAWEPRSAALARRQPAAQGQAAAPTPVREPRLAAEDEELPEHGPLPRPEAEPPGRRSWPEETTEPRGRDRAAEEDSVPAREPDASWELFAPRSSGHTRERSFDAIWPSEHPARDRREGHIGDREKAEERVSEAVSASGGAPQSATILKSGVINGMAYTLYTDGSIEAELPQGTLRFGSLDELRDYLARNT
jgi:hypothetical protein